MGKQHDKVVKQIKENNEDAKNLDIRVVDKICRHPLNFIANVMRDPLDERPIMLPYWGKFALMSGMKKG